MFLIIFTDFIVFVKLGLVNPLNRLALGRCLRPTTLRALLRIFVRFGSYDQLRVSGSLCVFVCECGDVLNSRQPKEKKSCFIVNRQN